LFGVESECFLVALELAGPQGLYCHRVAKVVLDSSR
jgi:hypothetical protein